MDVEVSTKSVKSQYDFTINYVIATYSGRHASRINDSRSGQVLNKQLSILYNIIKNKLSKGVPNLITAITIVCPKCKPEHAPPYENYYDKEHWSDMFNKMGICIEHIDYHGTNTNHSYDQWIQGMLYRPKVDYHIVIEDDYLINPEEIQFDSDLVNIYRRKFPNNIGYLTTLCGDHEGFGMHAMISNGIISTETVMSIPNILNEYYIISTETVMIIPNILNEYYIIKIYPQLAFSKLFLDNDIDILDYSDTYNIFFWCTTKQKIIDYSKIQGNRHLFLPFQSMDFNSNRPLV